MLISDWSSDVCASDRPQQQLLAQALHAGGTAQILDPQLTQVDLEVVGHPRQQVLQRDAVFLAGQLQADGDLEIVPVLTAGVQVHQHLRQVEEHRLRNRDKIGRASCRERVCQYV